MCVEEGKDVRRSSVWSESYLRNLKKRCQCEIRAMIQSSKRSRCSKVIRVITYSSVIELTIGKTTDREL